MTKIPVPRSEKKQLFSTVTFAEDGVDNTDVDSSRLYTQPEEVWQVYETLSAVPNGNFTVAAAFGNVHGVYAPGNVSLKPVILHNTQKYIKDLSLATNPQQ